MNMHGGQQGPRQGFKPIRRQQVESHSVKGCDSVLGWASHDCEGDKFGVLLPFDAGMWLPEPITQREQMGAQRTGLALRIANGQSRDTAWRLQQGKGPSVQLICEGNSLRITGGELGHRLAV